MTPDEFTLQETFVDVGDGHQLYVQDWGNKNAKTPIIYIHGGPGGSIDNQNRQRFNPYEQRVIFFDQRGCGRSVPYGSIEHNTTQHLVDDIEKIAQHLNLQTFGLTGSSWASCLALCYTIKYPKRVAGLIHSGIFTGTRPEIDYLNKGGFRSFFPDAWEHYLAQTPKSYQHDPSAYHFARILGSNEQAMRESAYIYSSLEGSLLKLDDRFMPEDPNKFDATPTKIEVHYLVNNCFLPDNYILKNAARISAHVWMVQGRYDFVCPPNTAYDLHHHLPDSTLIWTMAGHSSKDRSNYDVMRTILAQWN